MTLTLISLRLGGWCIYSLYFFILTVKSITFIIKNKDVSLKKEVFSLWKFLQLL